MRRMRSIALGIASLVVFPLSVWADNPHEVVIRDGAEQPLSWDDGSPSAPAPTPSLAKQEQRASPEPTVATAAHVEAPQPLVWSAETPMPSSRENACCHRCRRRSSWRTAQRCW